MDVVVIGPLGNAFKKKIDIRRRYPVGIYMFKVNNKKH